MHLPTPLLLLSYVTLLTTAPASALEITFHEKESLAPSPEDPQRGVITTCTGKSQKAGTITPASGCQKIPAGFFAMTAEWKSAGDNELLVLTSESDKCCLGAGGDAYAWSDSCYGLHMNILKSYRIVNTSAPLVGKPGENYECY